MTGACQPPESLENVFCVVTRSLKAYPKATTENTVCTVDRQPLLHGMPVCRLGGGNDLLCGCGAVAVIHTLRECYKLFLFLSLGFVSSLLTTRPQGVSGFALRILCEPSEAGDSHE
jgi:hypothetical protein